MTIDTKDLELVKKVIPKKQIINFDILGVSLSDEGKFKQKVQDICGEQQLPIAFPSLPLFFKGANEGFISNNEYRDKHLTLPPVLYNSDTYTNALELRGPMEDILLEYEKERVKHGLSTNNIFGNGWTKVFEEKFEKVKNQPIGKYEKALNEELDRRESERKISEYFNKYKNS